MYSMFIQVEYSGFVAGFEETVGRSIGQRALGNILGFANRETVLYWHRKFLPLHFTSAQRVYSNKRRKFPYSQIKKDLANGRQATYKGFTIREKHPVQRGGVIDNVRKGWTERQARQSPGVFASKTRGTLTMFVPRYAAIQNRDGNKPDKAAEITAVAPSEYPALRRVFQRTFVNRIGLLRDRVLKRI